MPLQEGDSRSVIGQNVRELMSTGRPQRQAVAIALNTAHPNVRKPVNPLRLKRGAKLTGKPVKLSDFMRHGGISSRSVIDASAGGR